MSTAICPACEASISWTEASRSDPPACPFCGANVQEQDFAHAEGSDEAIPTAEETPMSQSELRKIQIVEQTPDRLLLALDAAGRGAISLVVFAILWNAISWTVAIAFLSAGALGQMGAAGVVPFLGIGLFLVIGAFFIAWAINATFGRAFVLVERNRASVQSILFGWKRTKSVELGPASLAALEEAYKQNEVPVYRVKITGPNGVVRFGTALLHADKLWTVTTINQFLSPAACGDGVPSPLALNAFAALWQLAENAAPVEPMNLSAGSLVRIVDSGEDRLAFSLPLLPKRVGFVWASVVFIGLSLIVGFVWSAGVGNHGGAATVFLLPFVLVVLLQVAACVAIFRGRIIVRVDTERVLVRWHLGPVGPSKSLPTSGVDKVAVVASGEAMRHLALVGSGSTTIPLTTLHDRTTDEEVAGLVRWQLERLGRTFR
jgi:hypothetical protein